MSKEPYNRISDKMRKLQEYLGYLHEHQKLNEEEFVGDYRNFAIVERSFQIVIEAIVDIGKILLIHKGLRRPEDNQDVITVLHEAHILSEDLTHRLGGIVGFRNVLVHEYTDIDRKKVYDNLQKRLVDIDLFVKEIIAYLGMDEA